jgi:hypothetical protein
MTTVRDDVFLLKNKYNKFLGAKNLWFIEDIHLLIWPIDLPPNTMED